VARGFTARCPWRRRASPVRPVGTAPDGGEEPHTAKQMITAAPGQVCRIEQGAPCLP
jgi:hypothetical protein